MAFFIMHVHLPWQCYSGVDLGRVDLACVGIEPIYPGEGGRTELVIQSPSFFLGVKYPGRLLILSCLR